jgi:ketosteroid isomerase-like protein
MSQENVEIVKRSIKAYARGGVEAILPFFPHDVVCYPFPEWVEEGEYRGHDGFRKVAAIWTDTFDDLRLEFDEVQDNGSKVVALGTIGGRIKATGTPLRQPMGVVFSSFGNGLIGEMHYFTTWTQALEALGLEG